jgi:hypothetical protein
MSGNELFVMMSSSKKIGHWPFHVSTHHTFTSGPSRSCSKCSLGGSLPHMTQLCWLTHPEMWNFASLVMPIPYDLKKLSCCKTWVHTCAVDCSVSCLSCAVSFWTTCNLYGFRCRHFWRILWMVACSICNLLRKFTSSDSIWKPAQHNSCLPQIPQAAQ